jgi:hypothetical protein
MAHYPNVFNRRSLALVAERDALLLLRERVADAGADLAQRLALHEELRREIRGAGTMTEELWQRLIVTQDLTPWVSELMNWDFIKLLGTAAVVAGG